MTKHASLLASLFATFTLAASACQPAEVSSDTDACADGKCDDPGQARDRECQEKCSADRERDQQACVADCREERAIAHCEARRNDAILSSQKAFTADAIRWSCSDVEGVNTNGRDDRGQEYCEYYSIVAPPPAVQGQAAPAPVDFGRVRERDRSGEVVPGEAAEEPPLGLELTEDQIIALEDNPTAVVGECIFASWHSDIQEDLPICQGSESTCPELELAETAILPPWMTDRGLGFKTTQRMLRMKVSINSNGAASSLALDCMNAKDPEVSEELLKDDYMRGCMKDFELYGTEWRRSDPTICAATARAAECGCGVDTNADGRADITAPEEIAAALVPPQPTADGITLRGFRLGTWSDANALPAGCRYLETGDDSHTVVGCDLTGSDLLAGASDVKATCRSKYGDNVVVHIPIPAEAIVCTPAASGDYSSTCGEMVPWTAPDSASTGG